MSALHSILIPVIRPLSPLQKPQGRRSETELQRELFILRNTVPCGGGRRVIRKPIGRA